MSVTPTGAKNGFAPLRALHAAFLRENSPEAWSRLWVASALLGLNQLREEGMLQANGTLLLPIEDPWAWLAAGRFAESQGDWTQALRAYNHVVQIAPLSPLGRFWQAHTLARMGSMDEASSAFALIGEQFSWPAGTFDTRRVSYTDDTVPTQLGTCQASAAVEWLLPPPEARGVRAGTVVLVSLDGRYALRFGQQLIDSWRMLGEDPGLWLHIHLINAEPQARQVVVQWAQSCASISLSGEIVALPPKPSLWGPTPDRMAEHRTWFACARLRMLPFWLEHCAEGVVVTDADVRFLKDPRLLWAELGSASAGAVRFDPRTKVLWEEWYLTLALFRADTQGKRVAAALADYVGDFLARGQGCWGLDQAALWCVFASFGGPVGMQPALADSPVAAIGQQWVRWPGGPEHPEAVIDTSVASLSHTQETATQGVPSHSAEKLCYTRNFEDVMLQRVFADVAQGCYIDVGASHPIDDSNTYALYTRGWRGLCVEPLDYSRLWADHRPRDLFVNAAVGKATGVLDFHIFDRAQQISTGSPEIRTLWQARQIAPSRTVQVPQYSLGDLWRRHLGQVCDVHLLSIDVEGMEKDVLAGIDWKVQRPWLVVVEAVKPGVPDLSPMDWEPSLVEAGYVKVYFDGVNCFYLAHEREALRACFALPPNVWDGFVMARQRHLELELASCRIKLAKKDERV